MEIKDLERYVDHLVEGRTAPSIIGMSDEPLLKELLGKTSIGSYISNLTKFSVNIYEQVFYELLQNADDSGATHFYVFFDESYLLVINNGEPFITDGEFDEPGRLRSFLAKNKGAKQNDPNSIGKYGQGSKLLYDLLSDDNLSQEEGLKKALLEEGKGITLFSWKAPSSLDDIRSWKGNAWYKTDFNTQSTPTLLKTIFTYYPALPEESYTSLVANRKYFTNEEVKQFADALNKAFDTPHVNSSAFDKGTILFLPLGSGKFEKLKSESESVELIHGLSSSIGILPSVRTVIVNEKTIRTEKKVFKAELSIQTEVHTDSKASVFWAQGSNGPFKTGPNFYQYFPVTKEIYGLNLVVDSRIYDIDSSRQYINFTNKPTQDALRSISIAFCEYIEKLSLGNELLKLEALIRSVATANPYSGSKEGPLIKKLFHDDLLLTLKKNIPTVSGIKNSNEENCKIKKTTVPVSSDDLGISMFWVSSTLNDYSDELEEKLEIASWDIKNILASFSQPEKRSKWIDGLSKEEYQTIINELKGLLPARIRELSFLKFSDGKVYSFNQALNDETLVLLDDKTYPLKDILIKSGFIVGGSEVLQKGEKGLLEKLASSLPNPLSRWKAIWANVNVASLLHTEKWQIFRTLRDSWGVSEEYLGDELLLFKNREEVLQPLSKMLKAGHSHAPSGILKPFELFPTEVYKELDPYLMECKHIWNTLTHSWEKIKPEISLQNYMQVLKDLEKLFQKKEIGNKLQDQEWLMNQNGNLVSRDNIFYSTSIAALPQDQYSSLSALIERIADNLNLVPFGFLGQLDQINFAELPNSSLRNLAEKISKDNSRISPSEAKLLFGLKSNQEYFFSTFKIRKVDETILLVNNQSGIQFHANDAKLSYFLKGKSNYFELPQPLYEIFKEDGGLKRDYGSGVDEFARKLMVDFGAQKEFIDLVLRCNQETQLLYLNRIQRFDLSTQDNTSEYGPGSIEVKLIDLAKRLKQFENLRTKTYVDSTPLGSLTYEDRVLLKGNDLKFSFRLSNLITEYAAQATTINRLLDKFTNRFAATTFLETRSYPEGDIFNKILRDEDLSNPERVSFIAAYLLTQPENHNDQNLRNLNWLSLNKASVLSSLYRHEMDSFEQVIGSYYWTPKNHIYAPDDDSFLLESEKLPAWAKEWLGVNQERLKFLKAAGLRTVDDPTLVFRRAVLSGESLSGTAIADAANQPQPENTLKWLLGRNHISEYGSASHRLINNYIDKLAVESDALPPYLQRFNTNGRLTIQEMTPPYNALSLSGGINEEDLSIFPDVVSKTDRALVDIDLLSTDIQKRLEANGIPLAFLEKEITDQNANDLQEWSLGKYKEWKKDYDKYSIRVTRIAVPLTYYLKYGEEEKEISVRSIETSIRHNRRDGHVDLIVFREENKSVIEAIQEAKEELFEDDYKPLADLLAKFAVNDEDQLILDIIKDNEVTKEELEEMLRKGSLVKEPPPTYQEGSPDGTRVKIDITEEERQKIENSSEAIKKMLNQATESELNEISQRLQEVKDFMEGTEHKSSPSLLIGYIGEVLVVEWLKRINSTLSVDHVTISNQNGKIEQKYTAYDILVKHGTQKFEIDVKTTIKPLEEVSKSVAFYVSKRQYDHIAENPDNNYFIFRISLKELGLEPFYQELKRRNPNMNYEELINKEDADIRREINEFLSDPLKVSLLREHRMYFKLSVPKMSNLEVPF